MPIDDEIRALERALLRSGKNVVVLPRELWDEAADCLLEALRVIDMPGVKDALLWAPEPVKALCERVRRITGADGPIRMHVPAPERKPDPEPSGSPQESVSPVETPAHDI